MKVKHGHVLMIFICIAEQVTARSNYIPNILKNLHLTKDKNPLIVVMGPHNGAENANSKDYDSIYITEDNGVFEYVKAEADAKEEAKYLLYKYLLRTGDPQNTEEEKEDEKRAALREALRSRCKAKVRCEKKCDEEEEEDKYCPVNCKAVFDSLNLCEPPKEKEEPKCKKKEGKCGKRGRTMPPSWLRLL